MLRLLVERMGDVGWHLDEYSDEDLLTLSAVGDITYLPIDGGKLLWRQLALGVRLRAPGARGGLRARSVCSSAAPDGSGLPAPQRTS